MSDEKSVITSPTEETIKQPFWSLASDNSLTALQTNLRGLSIAEIESRRKIFGYNIINQGQRLKKTIILFRQFKSPLILALIIAGIITFFLGDWIESSVIIAAVMANVLLGFWQENKAENILEQLKSYIRTRARVRRNNEEHDIDAVELVPGDIIRLSQGDRVPADVRLLFTNNLEIDEAILTGESLPRLKNITALPVQTPLSERDSMAMGGTLIVQGMADGLVTATGNNTEFGRIAELAAGHNDEPTPLQKAVSRFATLSGIILCLASLIIFLFGFIRGVNLFDMFIITVAIIVSAVPEGLPIALTVILAVGVERLAKKKGVVKKLLAAETLGSTTLILTDKTGTLTQAKMQLASVVLKDHQDEKNINELIKAAILNTDVVIENPKDAPNKWRMSGKPLEIALVQAAALKKIYSPTDINKTEILDKLPFDSKYKYSMVLTCVNHETFIHALGAPEILLKKSNLNESDKYFWQEQIEKCTATGERVLGVAKIQVQDKEHLSKHQSINNLEFQGLISFRDPLRPGVKAAINKIAKAGVKTVIVTGDHPGTARAIAQELGIFNKDCIIITGEELSYLDENKLAGELSRVCIFARVTPEQKLMLTKAYQKQGEVVAVTGDGVNDAPALRAADIGVAVGSGTDVAKSAADLIILDNNFETIVTAIEEGKRIMSNIRKAIVYLLSNASSEIFLIGGALLAGLAIPINALQILFVNMFSDSFPAIAYAFEKNSDLNYHEPLNLKKRLLNNEMKFLILVIGTLTSAILFVLYYILSQFDYDPLLIKSFIFMNFASYSLIAAFSLRSFNQSVLSFNPLSNTYLTAGVIFGLLLIGLAIYLPFFNKILNTTPLPPIWIIAVFAICFLNILGIEFGKWLYRQKINY